MTEESRDEYLEGLKAEGLPEKLAILRQKLYQKAKNEPKFRFYTLYSHMYREDTLQTAWQLVKRNKGAAGVDGVRIEDIERGGKEGVDAFLKEIQEQLRTRSYKPGPVRRVYIPKPQGGERPLGIPNIKDRVVQAAARLILEPIFEADFQDCSYGFRPGRSQHDALEEVKKHLKEGFREVYDVDIKGYFDSIPHDKLLKSVEVRVADLSVIKLIRMWLRAPVVEAGKGGSGHQGRPTQGTPQGGVISPLLANIYLNWMDKLFNSKNGPVRWANARIVRFADDMVILARHVGTKIEEFTSNTLEGRLGLTINRQKTKRISLQDGREQLDFLGFTFRFDRDLQGRPWRYLNIVPSKKTLIRERARIKAMTDSSKCYQPITSLICELNVHLTSWKPYYNFGYPSKAFHAINYYVRQRLVVHLRRRSQRPFRPPPGVSCYECLERFNLVRL